MGAKARRKTGAHASQRAASGIPAGRRAKAVDLPYFRSPISGAAPQPGASFRQDAGKDTLEACAPVFIRAASGFRKSDAGLILKGAFLHSL